MSTTGRLISGSLASWTKISINFLTQLLFVPIYLTYWDGELYGLWLALQAAVSIFQMLDFGHIEYLGFEFLKIGRNNHEDLKYQLWSGFKFAIIVSLFELTIIGSVIYFDLISWILDESLINENRLQELSILFFLMYFSWVIGKYLGGIIQRALYPFGYFPRVNWWSVVISLATYVAPVIAVVLGAGLLTTGMVMITTDLVFSIVYYIDLIYLLRKKKLWIYSVGWKSGFKDYINSLMLSGKSLLEKFRQDGIRVILVAFVGGTGVATFSTIRTSANVLLQGLGTVTNPLMPELMHFLNEKDQKKTEASFSIVWTVILLLCPFVIFLQLFIEPLYKIWTRGELVFNPLLFAMFSSSVLVYGLAQPAIAVARGNNQLKVQLTISILSATIVLGGMYLLVPVIEINGAGIALLFSEIFTLAGYYYFTKQWFKTKKMKWPEQLFNISFTSVIISLLAIFSIVWLTNFGWEIAVISIFLLSWNMIRFYKKLPDIAILKAKEYLTKLPVPNILNKINI